MKLDKFEKAEEYPLTDEQLLAAKQDIETLVKLICYIGKDHPQVDTIANRIYDTWSKQ